MIIKAAAYGSNQNYATSQKCATLKKIIILTNRQLGTGAHPEHSR